MKSTAVSFQQIIQNQNQSKILRDGSSVLVRVLGDKGNGRYEVSVAGIRVNITANNPLKVGQTFVANVKTGENQIQLRPQNTIAAANNQNMLLEVADSKVFSFLASMELPSDEVAYNILQQYKQLNMKINVPLMNRIHQLAKRYPGKEKLASQIMINLISKGMDADDSEIEKLISVFEKDSFESARMGMDFGNATDFQSLKENIAQFFKFVLNDDENEKKIDILAINNHFPGWIFLPFEIYKNQTEVTGEGCIKLLIDNSKLLRRINVNCNYEGVKYNFSLDFAGKFYKDLKVNITPFDADSIETTIKKIRGKFLQLGKNVNVEWCDLAELEGTGCGTEKIMMFGGEV